MSTPNIAHPAPYPQVLAAYDQLARVWAMDDVPAQAELWPLHFWRAWAAEQLTALDCLVDAYAYGRLSALRRTSPSQVDSWEKCPRIWFAEKVEGKRAPSTPAQERGTEIHRIIEDSLHAGQLTEPDHEYAPIVRDGMRLWPSRDGKEWVVEHEEKMQTYPGGPVMHFVVDLAVAWHQNAVGTAHDEETFHYDEVHVDVWDHKSTSDFRYCKTPEELVVNTQMICYARWAYEDVGAGVTSVGHLYYRTKMPPRSKQVGPVAVPRAHVEAEWQERLDVVRQMTHAARTCRSADDLPPLGASDVDKQGKNMCERYGGCAQRQRCGLDALGGPKNMSDGAMTLSQRLQMMHQQNQEQPPNAAGYNPPPQHQAPPAGIPINTNTSAVLQANGAVPFSVHLQHPGALGIAGYKPGQPCNGRGYYAGPEGGFIQVEPGHACPVCNPAMVVPGDAPARTSTAAEIAEVEEKKGKKGKGKPKAMDPMKLIETYAKLQAAGFSTDEIAKMQRDGILEDALAGKVSPGMLRQPPNRESARPPAPEETPKSQATLAPLPPRDTSQPTAWEKGELTHEQSVQLLQEQWFKNSGPPTSTAPGPQFQLAVPKSPAEQAYEYLISKGFTVEQVNLLNEQGVVEAALRGEITPGHLASTAQVPPVANMLPGEISKPSPPEPRQLRTSEGGPVVVDAPHGRLNPDAQRAQARAVIDQAAASRRKAPPKLPPTPPVVLVDVFFTKTTESMAKKILGDSADGPVDLADWLAPVAELAAMAHVDDRGNPAPLDHWSLAPYARGKGLLAAAIRECLESCPAVVLVDSSLPGADVFLEQVKPHAALVVEPRGSRR